MGTLDWDDYDSLLFGFAVTVMLIGGYGLGLRLRRYLPAKHQTHESLEIVHAIIGMLVAMAAILLGLQLDAATKSFDKMDQLVERYSIQVIQLDAMLRDFGPPADAVRQALKSYMVSATASLERGESGEPFELGQALREVNTELLRLMPTNAIQSRVQSDSLSLIQQLFEERWQLIAGTKLTPSVPLYVVLLVWLVLVYSAFGLNAAFNTPVFVVLLLSAFAVGIAVFVLADMGSPFGGLISVSPHAMQQALHRISE